MTGDGETTTTRIQLYTSAALMKERQGETAGNYIDIPIIILILLVRTIVLAHE